MGLVMTCELTENRMDFGPGHGHRGEPVEWKVSANGARGCCPSPALTHLTGNTAVQEAFGVLLGCLNWSPTTNLLLLGYYRWPRAAQEGHDLALEDDS